MKNKKICFFVLIILFSCIFSINIISASEENENIYLENEYFKIISQDENSIMPINSLKVFIKQNNKQIGDTTWSSAVLLNNGNAILGNFVNEKYSYYELSKNGDINFLVELNYYIKDTIKDTENYIIIEPYTVDKEIKYLLGVLDKEFKVIYDTIFEYKQVKFLNGYEILKPLGEKYGFYSIDGKTIIEPIFDNLSYNSLNIINAIYDDRIYTLQRYGNGYKNTTMLKEVDIWARDSVLKSIELGLVSDKLQLHLKKDITREEFTEIIINLYERETGAEIDISNLKNPFLDTNNKKILKAYKLGIILGKTQNKFEPNSYITREETSVIVYNLLKLMGVSIPDIARVYSDNNEISKWAYNSVMSVSAANIMEGDNNYFKPKNKITVQEALIVICRIKG